MTTATKERPSRSVAKKAPAKKAAPKKPATKAVAPAEPPIDEVVLRASTFATAWTWVARAMSKDDCRPLLASMCIEVFSPQSVRLVATDSYSMLWAWVGCGEGDEDEPALTVDPKRTLVARDQGRSKAFMGWLAKGDLADEITLTVNPTSVTMSTAWESLTLPFAQQGDSTAEYPDWRKIADRPAGKAPEKLCLAKERLALVTLPKLPVTQREAVMTFDGDLGPVHLEWPHATPPIHGLLMPIRTSGS